MISFQRITVVLSAAWWLVPVLARGQELEPSEADKARYQQVVEVAVAEHAAGNWAEARALFLQAHALWPSARTFRTLGMTSFELKQYARAIEELEAALTDARRPLDADKRAEVVSLVERAQAFVGRFVVEVSPATATLELDRERITLPTDRVLRLALGAHTLTARALGHHDATVTLTVQGNEDAEVSLALERIVVVPTTETAASPAPDIHAVSVVAATAPAAPEPQPESAARGRLWSWVALGSTLAFATAGGVLLYAADREFDTITESCAPLCEANEVDRGPYDTFLLSSRIAFAVSALSAVGTVILFAVEGDGGAESDLSLRLGPGGARLSGRF